MIQTGKTGKCFFNSPGNIIISLLLLIVTGLPGIITAQNSRLQNVHRERLTYDVVYHWGIIWKKAAVATLTIDTVIHQGKNRYQARLEARTLAFADRIFRVRDTLYSVMEKMYFKPVYYAKVADENGTYRKDVLNYRYNGKQTSGETILYRPHRNAIDTVILNTVNMAYDMLSVFYYIRTLDLPEAKMYQQYSVQIFSGDQVEKMVIEYLGRTIATLPDKREFSAFKLGLRFFDEKGNKSSDNITAWISDDVRRIPLMVEGKLPIGSVKAVYTGR